MRKFWLFLFWTMPFCASAQLIDDAESQQLILKTLDKIYNYEFDEADGYLRQVKVKYPQHPVAPILKAVELYWQYLPINQSKAATAQYLQYLNQGLAQSKAILARDEDNPEGIFFSLAAHGYLAMKYHFDNELLKAGGEARKAYGYMKQGLKLTEKNPEFYFTAGLYNYYIERYPDDHPLVKPIVVFFQSGDMALGLRQLETAMRRGTFTRPEAGLYLGEIYLKHESQPAKAVAAFKPFADKYPNNPIFALHCAEALVMTGRSADAQVYVQRMKQMPQKFLAMPVKVLEAMMDEKAGDLKQAIEGYQSALRLPYDPVFTKEFAAHADAGLARIAARAGNRDQAKAYYKKVLDIAEYKSNIREAKNYLK